MSTMKEYNGYGEDLESMLKLKTSPLAVKMLRSEDDIPEGAVRPKRDRGYHLAQCQTFAMSRRENDTLAMLKEDNWCPGPLIAYGLVEPQQRQGSSESQDETVGRFKYGEYIGIVTAPLRTANFEPDVVIVYSNTAQLRSMLLTIKEEERPSINSYFFPWSCSYAVVNPIQTGQYWIVLPDPGEYERALGGEDEMMFSIPCNKLEEFMADFRKGQEGSWGHNRFNYIMMPDFPQPDIYKNVFKQWGLDSE